MCASASPVRSIPIPLISVCFVNLSTITRMALCPHERGRGLTMSQEIMDQGPLMWVEQGSMLGAVRLRLLACFAPPCIVISILYHVHPPVGLQQCGSQLLWAWVPCTREIMLKTEDHFVSFCWHPHDPSLSPSCLILHPLIIKPLWLLHMYCTVFLEQH